MNSFSILFLLTIFSILYVVEVISAAPNYEGFNDDDGDIYELLTKASLHKRFRGEPIRFGKRSPRVPIRFGKRSEPFYEYN
ncbi:unnamed protein product [Auanema sp. JU1783]|nr:unnamed protein product [Auanema sp. JU1783]